MDAYNDNDPGACAWLRELIARNLIPKGEVLGASILDLRPSDLAGFRRVHFFAGIGGWPYALRLAGINDDDPRRIWTGSPPCQPFSAAGKQLGRDDPRHLAPHFISLVGACRPDLLFGEQVASAEVFGKSAIGAAKGPASAPAWAWLDDLSDRLEAARYAVGASDIPAASIGAPHIRQRTFFGAIRLDGLADAHDEGPQGRAGMPERAAECAAGSGGMADRLADADGERRRETRERVVATGWPEHLERDGIDRGLADADGQRHDRIDPLLREEEPGRIAGDIPQAAGGGGDDRLADAECPISRRRPGEAPGAQAQGGRIAEPRDNRPVHDGADSRSDPPDGFWRGADWLFCRDGKWRPVEPGLEPLADGLPARVVRLRGYGNAIVPQVAAAFVQAFLTATEGVTP